MRTVLNLPNSISLPGIETTISEYQQRITDFPLEVETGMPADSDTAKFVGLDRQGKQVTTEALHNWLTKKSQSGTDVHFLIGGKQGLEPAQRERCDWLWSVGPLVMNQFVAAVVVAEQLYRCYCLRTDHPYH